MSFYKSLFNLTQVEADVLRFPTGAATGLFLVCADSDGTFSWQNIGNYAVTNLTGVANRITITNNGGGSFTISTPQDINTTSTPTFNQIRLTASPVNNYFLKSDASGNGSWSPVSAHAITDIFGTVNQINVSKNINNEATLSTPQNLDTACNFQCASNTASSIIYSPTYQISDIPGAQWRILFGNYRLNFIKQDYNAPYNFPSVPLIWFENGNMINSSIFAAITSGPNNPKYSFQGHPNDGMYHSSAGVLGLTNVAGRAYLEASGDFHTTENLKISNNKSLYIGSNQYTQTDLNKITGITNGSASANKALVVDSFREIDNIARITATNAIITNFVSNTDFNVNSIDRVSVLGLSTGSVSAPSLNFYTNDCGIFSSANRHINFTCNGTDRFEVAHSGNTSKQSLSISSGSLNTNSLNSFSGSDITLNSKNINNFIGYSLDSGYRFINATNYGLIYDAGATSLQMITGGFKRFEITNANTNSYNPTTINNELYVTNTTHTNVISKYSGNTINIGGCFQTNQTTGKCAVGSATNADANYTLVINSGLRLNSSSGQTDNLRHIAFDIDGGLQSYIYVKNGNILTLCRSSTEAVKIENDIKCDLDLNMNLKNILLANDTYSMRFISDVGSVSAPAYTFDDGKTSPGKNSGLYGSALHQISLSLDGTERIRFAKSKTTFNYEIEAKNYSKFEATVDFKNNVNIEAKLDMKSNIIDNVSTVYTTAIEAKNYTMNSGGSVTLNNSTSGYTPSNLNYYEEYTDTFLFYNLTSAPISIAYKVVRVGKTCTLSITNWNVTATSSNKLATLSTGLYARHRPKYSVIMPVVVQNGLGVFQTGKLLIDSGGDLEYFATVGGGNFTSGNYCEGGNDSVSYCIN